MLKRADWRADPGSTLYLVGGSLRAFARHAMTVVSWPIDDPHGFEIAAAPAQAIAKSLARRKPETLQPVPGLSSSRLAALPDTADLLFVLIRALQPARLVFSSWGLREGLLWERMQAGVRLQDPLVAGAAAFTSEYGIAAGTAAMVSGWTSAARLPRTAWGTEHLRLTATMLCLATGMVEPNLRGDLAREWALRKRWIGASPADRAMLAAAMIANTGRLDLPVELGRLAPAEQLGEAQAWGLATRLCRRFSGNTAQGISGSALTVEAAIWLRFPMDQDTGRASRAEAASALRTQGAPPAAQVPPFRTRRSGLRPLRRGFGCRKDAQDIAGPDLRDIGFAVAGREQRLGDLRQIGDIL